MVFHIWKNHISSSPPKILKNQLKFGLFSIKFDRTDHFFLLLECRSIIWCGNCKNSCWILWKMTEKINAEVTNSGFLQFFRSFWNCYSPFGSEGNRVRLRLSEKRNNGKFCKFKFTSIDSLLVVIVFFFTCIYQFQISFKNHGNTNCSLESQIESRLLIGPKITRNDGVN